MKKYLKYFIIIGLLIGAFFIWNTFFNVKNTDEVPVESAGSEEDSGMSISFSGSYTEEAESEIVETSSGIVYTGKVIPIETRYYIKDATREFRDVYVEEGQTIEKGKLLFDYFPDYSIDAQIDVTNKKFIELKDALDGYYTQIEEYKSWLAGTEDKGYIDYLNKEIAKTEGLISQNKVDWISYEEKIRKLRKAKEETGVESEIAGFVYEVNKDNTSTPTNVTPTFVTIYSLDKKVRISVSEVEYRNLSVGQKVNVKIESMNKEFEGEIIYVDSLPNNLESSDTSYYNVDISVESDVPYGYTAVVTVGK